VTLHAITPTVITGSPVTGTATYVAGTVTVSSQTITANTRISVVNAIGSTNVGCPFVTAQTPGTPGSFIITSAQASPAGFVTTDTGTVTYTLLDSP
jgi:hypothetical protein